MNKSLKYLLNSLWSLIGFLWLGVIVVPIIFIANNSFKSLSDFFNTPLWGLPAVFRFSNYMSVFKNHFFTYFLNSIFIVVSSLIILISVSLMVAYVFKRRFTKGMKFIYVLMIAGMTIPIHITLIPIYSLTNAIGLYDTMAALIGPYVAFNIPISVFILTSFLREIPQELEEAASIDGAGMVSTFTRIIIPVAKPSITAVAILNGVNLWNEFIFPLILINSENKRPLTMAIWNFKGEFSANIPVMMAALLLSVLPFLIIYSFTHKHLIQGMTAGAVKG
jgi:raffinose/stachyose/melibiose transport system permease protein